MTVSEIKSRFLLLLDAAYSQAAPGFEDSEISEFLDKAQKDYVSEAVKNKVYDDIYQLMEVTYVTLNYGHTGNTYSFEVDNILYDYGYYVSSRMKVQRTVPSMSGVFVECDLISPDIASNFFTNGFNKPYFKNPKVFIVTPKNQDSKLTIIVDAYTKADSSSNNFEITYIKIPKKVDITTGYGFQINNNVYEKLIEIAVKYAVDSLKTAKISTQ